MPFSSENGRVLGHAMPEKWAKLQILGITLSVFFVKVLELKELLILLGL